MSFLNLFRQKNNSDPYWEFDQSKHFRPAIAKAQFFRETGYDFGWLLLKPLSEMVESPEHELKRGKRLSYGQKALYYWWYVDAQVTNGGFVQFYYNGYAHYVPVIIKGLEYIGDEQMAEVIRQADTIYQQNRNLIEKAREEDLFGSDLYEQLEALGELDSRYINRHTTTLAIIEEYARKNPQEFCVDEHGQEYSATASGLVTTTYPNGNKKEEFYLNQGVIDGAYKTYHENGKPKDLLLFTAGKRTSRVQEWYANGNLKFQSAPGPLGHLKTEYFYENGKPQKLEYKTEEDERIGEYKEWYENGQLKESSTFISDFEREGPWLKFYPDGKKKLEAEFRDKVFLLNNAWDADGNQTLKDGTGLYIDEYTVGEGQLNRQEQEYKNSVRDGISRNFTNGILSLYQEFEGGKEHGYTRRYYNNGNLSEEILYSHGVEVTKRKFDIFQKAAVVTAIVCKMQDQWLVNRKLATADTYPVPINAEALGKNFQVDTSLFEGYPQDYTLNYKYFVTVDQSGRITNFDFLGASNGRIIEQVQANIPLIRFKPAIKGGTPVQSYVIVDYEFRLGEFKDQ